MEIEQNETSISLENSTKELTPPKADEIEGEAEVEVENKSCFVLTQQSFPRKWFIRIFKNPYPFITTLVQYSVQILTLNLVIYFYFRLKNYQIFFHSEQKKNHTYLKSNPYENIEHFLR